MHANRRKISIHQNRASKTTARFECALTLTRRLRKEKTLSCSSESARRSASATHFLSQLCIKVNDDSSWNGNSRPCLQQSLANHTVKCCKRSLAFSVSNICEGRLQHSVTCAVRNNPRSPVWNNYYQQKCTLSKYFRILV